jgi:hypothetical protein
VFDKSNTRIRIKPALYQIVRLIYSSRQMEEKQPLELLLVPLFFEKF